jgi:hypothetical protein
VVADAREILHTTTTNQDHRVLLKIVAFATDVARDFESVRQTDAANLAER